MAIDPKIKQKAEDIRIKKKGIEVRESLASGLEAISEDVVGTINRQNTVEETLQQVIDNTTGKDVISAPEIIAARVDSKGISYPNIKTRIDNFEVSTAQQLAQIKRVGVVDLVLFAGQSNMAGRGVASEATVLADGEGYEFKSISDPTKLYKAAEPFGRMENNPNGLTEGTKTGGMVTSIMKNYFQKTGIPIVGVSASKGGTSINLWQPDGAFLNDAKNRFILAENWLNENGYTVRNKYLVWCQGESDGDTGMLVDEYTDKFMNMCNHLTSELGLSKTFMVRIGNHNPVLSRYDQIISAQTQICKTYDDVVMVSTRFAEMAERGLMKDNYHYTQEAYNEVGLDAGYNMAFYEQNAVEPYMYDPEYDNLYVPGLVNTNQPYQRLVFPFNSAGENGLEINGAGTFSGGKITTSLPDNRGSKKLDVPFEITKKKDWTFEVIARQTTSDSRTTIASAGATTGGLILLPNSAGSIFRLRDLNYTYQITATLPSDFDGSIAHQYAVTCENGVIKMYLDYNQLQAVDSGSFNDFKITRLLGGFGEISNNFIGECHYIALTDGKAVPVNDMHRE